MKETNLHYIDQIKKFVCPVKSGRQASVMDHPFFGMTEEGKEPKLAIKHLREERIRDN